jgi:hypothetical protein
VTPAPYLQRHATACERDPDAFDVDRGIGRDRLGELRALCAACPRLQPCRTFVLDNDVPGFAGGMTSGERRRAGAPYTDNSGHLVRREVAA